MAISHLATWMCLLLTVLMVGIHTASVHGKDEDNALAIVETEGEESQDVHVRPGAFSKEDYDPDAPVFVPGREWQPVLKGQAIPAGLHVRLNMETGEREAKLLDGDDGSRFWRQSEDELDGNDVGQIDGPTASNLNVMKESIESAMKELQENQGSSDKTEDNAKYWNHATEEMYAANKDQFTREELKLALKNFKMFKSTEKTSGPVSPTSQYRSAAELKEAFKEMNLQVKTDLEILRELLDQYKKSDLSPEARVLILTDFEYYVHQIDNARDLADLGGLEVVVRDLNHTDVQVRGEAAFVIGSAVQSNPKVQIAAVEAGAIQQLIRLLSVETNTSVKNRVLYAISSLTRHFPYAQQKFLEQGGLQALTPIFHESGTEKLRIKAVTWITDLIQEQRSARQTGDEEELTLKLQQYKKIPLEKTIIDLGWCDVIASLLALPEHDTREKVLDAMSLLSQPCQDKFINAHSSLQRLKVEYEQLSHEEKLESTDDLYFSGLLQTVDSVIHQLAFSSKEEL